MTKGIIETLKGLVISQLGFAEKDVILTKARNQICPLPYVFITCKGRSLVDAPGWEHWSSGKSFVKVRRIYRVEEQFEIIIRRQDLEEILKDIACLSSSVPSRIIVDDTIARLGVVKTSTLEGDGELDSATGTITVKAEYGVYAKTETQAIKKIRLSLVTKGLDGV